MGRDSIVSPLLLASSLASMLATYLFLPWLIRSLRGTSLVGKDLNKPDRRVVPEMGGIAVILGFYVGVSLLVVLAAYEVRGAYYHAALGASLGAGVVGLMDDMFGLRRFTKVLLPFALSLPLGAAVYSSGDRFVLGLDLGVLMVFAVALGVTSAANASNMLEGLNGLGAGLCLIIALTLVGLSAIEGAPEGFFILFPLIGALLGFLWFNRFPARVFPGDSMTLFAGAALASAAIIANPPLKTLGAILFLPMMAEFLLKARGRFKGENYGNLTEDGRLSWNSRVESLAHAVMRWKPLKEWQVVAVLWLIEIAVCTIAIWVALVT